MCIGNVKRLVLSLTWGGGSGYQICHSKGVTDVSTALLLQQTVHICTKGRKHELEGSCDVSFIEDCGGDIWGYIGG